MEEANQVYHPQIVRTIVAIALWEARKEIKRNIQREGRIKLCKVPHREIERLAKLMVLSAETSSLRRPRHRALCSMKFVGCKRRRSGSASVSLNEILNI